MGNSTIGKSFPHPNSQPQAMDHNNMRSMRDQSLAPQASASTNSATRAFGCQSDGVSQETASTSSADGIVEKLPTDKFPVEPSSDSSGNRNATYAERPSFEPPTRRRGRRDWARCIACELWFATDVNKMDERRYCSRKCQAAHAKATGKFRGANNPRWIGGVSNDNMWYRSRQMAREPLQEAARRAVYEAVRAGRLARQPCERCGYEGKTHGHHDDYTKPLAVRWLCRPCHTAFHTEERRSHAIKRHAPTPENPFPVPPPGGQFVWRGKLRNG